jgi:hypothetical protein
LAVNTRYVCWGVDFVDLDNDGWLDIFHVTGTVYPEVEKVYPDYKFKTQRVVYRNLRNGASRRFRIFVAPPFSIPMPAAAALSATSITTGTSMS